MVKTFIGGVVIGIANIIPGVSGGTMMVLMGMYRKLLDSISNLFMRGNKNRINDFIYLLTVSIGAVVGIVGFANVLNILFINFETQTYYFFIGLIVSSLIIFVRKEFSDSKIEILWMIVGFVIIVSSLLFTNDSSFSGYPELSLYLIIILLLVGIISGGSMIIPGVSGSLILLIFGKYHLIRNYVSEVLSFDVKIMVPIFVFGIGVLIGIYLTAKTMKELLKKYRVNSLSFIVGLIAASVVVVIPFETEYNLFIVLSSILSLAVGYISVKLINI